MNLTDFVDTAETLTDGCHRHYLRAPAFRARPARPGGPSRSLKRLEDGSGLITVEIADRADEEVRDDMIRGILAFNDQLHPDIREEYFHLLVTAVVGLPPDSVPEPDYAGPSF